MNKPVSKSDLKRPTVTTGPLAASRKVYTHPDAANDLRVPFREIALSPESSEASFRVYDSSGPYTDPVATIDVEKGLPRIRDAWIEARGGIEAYEGRAVKPEDNGNVSGSHAARAFPNVPRPVRGIGTKPVTQLDYARAGIVTKEMTYVAHRENLGRAEALERAKERARTTGYAEGWAQGQREAAVVAEEAAARAKISEQQYEQRRAAALAQAVNALGRAVTELETQLMPTFTELQEVLLTHAFELAEAIVGRSLDDPQRRTADALRRAMAAAPESGTLVVHLSSDDYQTLVGADGPADFDHEGRHVSLRPDPALRPGDATAQTGMATVDATIAAAVARAREVLRL
jgi:flagellar assembly protein FliH